VTLSVGPLLGIVLLPLAAGAALIVRLGGLGLGRQILTASLRAVVQLAVVSSVIAAVLRSGIWTAVFIGGMVVIASITAGRRITGSRSAGWAVAPIVAGVAPVLGMVMAVRLVPAKPVAVLPIAGILIGGAMTATALAGTRARDELRSRYGEYEARLALGYLPRDAALGVCRQGVALALVPVLDQTRTVGLVTLPGAFVGVLLGGASPIRAGAMQVLILVALLAVEAISVLATLEPAVRDILPRTPEPRPQG
jgi:putative ABC transport system permease protein